MRACTVYCVRTQRKKQKSRLQCGPKNNIRLKQGRAGNKTERKEIMKDKRIYDDPSGQQALRRPMKWEEANDVCIELKGAARRHEGRAG